jgi:hypothetical protein
MAWLTVYPVGNDKFRGELDGEVLVARSRQPLVDAARVLLRRGYSEDFLLGAWHAGSPHHALNEQPIGELAKWTYVWRDKGGIRREPYRESPF